MATPQELHAHILRKAYEDESYRDRLCQNPKAGIQEAMEDLDIDERLRDDLDVEVHLETPTKFHLVVPVPPSERPPEPPHALYGCTWLVTGCVWGTYWCE